MSTYTVHWLARAVADRNAIVSYIATELFNPPAAIQFGDEVEKNVDLISATGVAYRRGKVAGTRECVVTPTYVLVYRFKAAQRRVEILRILQTRRRKTG